MRPEEGGRWQISEWGGKERWSIKGRTEVVSEIVEDEIKVSEEEKLKARK
jgi:hypothetical protein